MDSDGLPLLASPPLSLSLAATSAGSPTPSVSTLAVPAAAAFVQVTYNGSSVGAASLVVVLTVIDATTLQSALGGSPAVAATHWNGWNATRFTDRYLLHPDRTVGSPFPLVMLNCTTVNVNAVWCSLPRLQGSLWRIGLAWAHLYNGALVVMAPISFSSMGSPQAPLTLTFPLPVLQPTSAQRFTVVQPTNLRLIPTNPPYDLAFDVSSTRTVNVNGTVSFPSISQASEPLLFQGNFTAAPPGSSWLISMFRLYVGLALVCSSPTI